MQENVILLPKCGPTFLQLFSFPKQISLFTYIVLQISFLVQESLSYQHITVTVLVQMAVLF
jgi:hypothetical protein